MQEDHVWAAAQREELLMSNCSMKSAQKHRCENVTRTVSNLPQSLWSNQTALFHRTLVFSVYDFCLLKHKCVFDLLNLCGISVKLDSCSSVPPTSTDMQENPTLSQKTSRM